MGMKMRKFVFVKTTFDKKVKRKEKYFPDKETARKYAQWLNRSNINGDHWKVK